MGSFPETYHFINGTLTLGSERGRGSLIPYSRTFFTTIPHPELLKSLPRILLSFPIPHPVPRFRRIPPVEYRSNLVSRQEFFRFPNPALCFGQISDPEGRYPSRPFDLMTHYCLQLCCLYFMLAIQTFQEDLNSRP